MARERTSFWSIGCDYLIAVPLVDYAGAALEAGSVSGQLKDDRGVAIGSAVTFTFNGTDDVWEGTLTAASSAGLVEGYEYTMWITAANSASPAKTVVFKIAKPAGYLEAEEVVA
jgi:hypothetical protein